MFDHMVVAAFKTGYLPFPRWRFLLFPNHDDHEQRISSYGISNELAPHKKSAIDAKFSNTIELYSCSNSENLKDPIPSIHTPQTCLSIAQ